MDAYREQFLTQDRFETTVVVEADGHVIGDLMLEVQDAWGQTEVADRAKGTQAELGWVLDPRHTGHGYATEAVRALIDISFNGLGLRRVTAACFADNDASWRLMERVGMRRETYNIRDSLHRSGEWLDGMVYALLADEHQPHTPPAAAVGHSTHHTSENATSPHAHDAHPCIVSPHGPAPSPCGRPGVPAPIETPPGPRAIHLVRRLAVTRNATPAAPTSSPQPPTSDHRPARPSTSLVTRPHSKEVHDAHTRLARHTGRRIPGTPAVVMASRFQLGRARNVPRFLYDSLRIRRQVLRTPGALGVSLIARPLKRQFLTLSAWSSTEALNQLVREEPHRSAMKRHRAGMADAQFVFWNTDAADLPVAWDDAIRRLDTDDQQPAR